MTKNDREKRKRIESKGTSEYARRPELSVQKQNALFANSHTHQSSDRNAIGDDMISVFDTNNRRKICSSELHTTITAI